MCDRLGITDVDYWRGHYDDVFAAARREGLPRNPELKLRNSTDLTEEVWHPVRPVWRRGTSVQPRVLPGGAMLGSRRSLSNHEYTTGPQHAPPLDLLEIPNGTVMRMAGAYTILAGDRVSVLKDVSSNYAPLVHVYDFNAKQRVDRARYVPGAAFVLMSDIGESNYCHWLLDELPRLALLDDRPDTSLIVAKSSFKWRRECLDILRYYGDRIVVLDRDEALRAENLLVPNTQEIWHPARKGSSRVLDWIRSSVGFEALAELRPDSERVLPKRLYIGRGDASSRRLINEEGLLRVLRSAGFTSVTLSGLPVGEQFALFACADVIIGLHGAGLSNIVFCNQGTSVLEIFSPYHGTPAFGMIASACELRYGSYCAEPGQLSPEEGGHMLIDVPSFWRSVKPWLDATI